MLRRRSAASCRPTPSCCPDRAATDRFALIVADSWRDLDEENHEMHGDDDAIVGIDVAFAEDPTLDWDGVLLDAMATLGLEPVGMPDWLWAQVRWANAA
ncbi:hypothetical protein ACQP00_21220 [Dactylosporangium sp. CS-047395]|uniref:hypothetical protein n=1 Tax=Dactylosporangium sp. CS-047395 TaxID=3239936 RepID=UPI003D90F85E